MNKIVLSYDAKNDLKEIKKYISKDLDNEIAANNTVSKITKSIRRLEAQPLIGAPLSSIIEFDTNYRFLVCGNYMVFYRLENNVVLVSRIIYGRRDYMKILFKNEWQTKRAGFYTCSNFYILFRIKVLRSIWLF